MATVVEAVGSASGSLNPDGKAKARVIELAMAEEVKRCVAEGISLSDSETIKARMQAVREKIKSSSNSSIIHLPRTRSAKPRGSQ